MPKLSQMALALPELCPVLPPLSATNSTQKQVLKKKMQETSKTQEWSNSPPEHFPISPNSFEFGFSLVDFFFFYLKAFQTFLTLTLTLNTFICGQFPLSLTPYSPSVYTFEFLLTLIILWCIYQLLNLAPEHSGKKNNHHLPQ